MKDNKKIFLSSILLILMLFASIIKTYQNKDILEEKEAFTEVKRMVKINDVLYYDMDRASDIEGRCGVMDGKIESHVSSLQIPTNNNEANFDGDYEYQFESMKRVALFIDNKWQIFEAPSFVRTYTLEHIKSGEEENSYYLTLSIYQGETETVLVNNFYGELNIEDSYEFEFILKTSSENIEDSIKSIFNNSIIADVRKTDKLGMEQIQEKMK